MYRQYILSVGILGILALLSLVGCGGPTNTQRVEASAATFTPRQPVITPTSKPPTATPTQKSPTSTPTPLPPTATPTPLPPTPTVATYAMNERVCNDSLCLTVIGAGDLGKSFVFTAPEEAHFLGIFVSIENLMDQALPSSDFAESISIDAGKGAGGFATLFSGTSVLFPPFNDEFGPGQTTDIGLLFVVSDDSDEFSLIHDSLPPIILEVEETD